MVGKSTALSGWILPDGHFVAGADWWHLNTLFDLRDNNCSHLTNEEARAVLDSGDEDRIKTYVTSLGFVKIGRGLIEAQTLNDVQLKTLQEQLQYMNPEDEFRCYFNNEVEARTLTVARLMKAKTPRAFFS